MKKEYGWYRRTFDPSNASDRLAMRRMVAGGQKIEPGDAGHTGSESDGWMFTYLPLSDRVNGRRRRCPLGAEIYTPYGWNNLGKIAEAFARGETVWIESESVNN